MNITYKGRIVSNDLVIPLEEISANVHGNKNTIDKHLLKATGLVEICLSPPEVVKVRLYRNGRNGEAVISADSINTYPLLQRAGISYLI